MMYFMGMQRLDTMTPRSKEQSTKNSDLTGDYKTAFNLGKQQEVEMRIKHSKDLPNWKR